METKNISMNVKQIIEDMDNGKWDFDLLIQREAGQWDNEQQSLLIDTLIRGFKMPAIWLTKGLNENGVNYSVIDGKQRCTTIYNFVHNEFKLHKSLESFTMLAKDYDNIEEDLTVELAGKKFSDLPKAVQDIIIRYDVDIVRMMYYTDEQIEEQFYRLNNGATFTKAQKANVSLGSELAGKLKEIEALPFWEKANFSKNQRKHGEITACILQCLMLLTGFEYKNFGANEVLRFAKYYADNYNTKDLEYLTQLINKLDKCFPFEKCNSNNEFKKFIKKVNIPALIMNLDCMLGLDEEISDEQYKEFITDFIINDYEVSGYEECCTRRTTNIENVGARISLLENYLKPYVYKINHNNENEEVGDYDASSN